MSKQKRGYIHVLFVMLLLFSSCSLTRYVPENEVLLNKNKIKVDNPEIESNDFSNYLLQSPNSYFWSIARIKLALYSTSKPDTTKWINRWLRKVGEPPVIYDSVATKSSRENLAKMMHNKGYWSASVDVSTKVKKKKMNVTYNITANEPYAIGEYDIYIADSVASRYIEADSANALKVGDVFDVDLLNRERERVTTLLRRHGYYNFQKECVGFLADTTMGDHRVGVLMSLQPQYTADSVQEVVFRRKRVDHILICVYSDNSKKFVAVDTVEMDGVTIVYDKVSHAFRPNMLAEKVSIRPHSMYNERTVQRTYENLSSLSAVKYVSISFEDISDELLRAIIYISPEKRHGYTIELEGTNSSGNFGVGTSIDYVNKNIFHGAETFKIGAHGSYEMMGKVGSLRHLFTVGGSALLSVPSVLLPASQNFRRRSGGTTEFSINYDYQHRPHYHRNIFNAGIRYAWRQRRMQYNFNLLDVSYVYLPWVDDDFRDMYLSPSSSNRFSFEDHFIMRLGFNFTFSNKRSESSLSDYSVVRASVNTAGNLLYGMSNLFHQQKDEDGGYKMFNIRYSQYVKGEFDYVYNHKFSERNSIVFHAAIGAAIPYGNGTIIPYEERFFSGGANSVRGWSVRELGPGSYKNQSGDLDYMNQSGDIKLDLNLEARLKLLWKIHAAVFLDAGNIWTIRDYAEQPGGQFLWNSFYKQIACSYGVGLRLDFSFFVIRVDMGVKLFDPSYSTQRERWRSNLKFRDDVAFHFAVGYPF
ncbi:MAG: BamA/TamA family outer membrane protein [Bacteroidales bacterium]|nr:BamA/TamA family outer membrane protein [Bacteroidales bacterium]